MLKFKEFFSEIKKSSNSEQNEISSVRRAIADLKQKMNNPDYSDAERKQHKDWHDKEVKRLKLYGVDEAEENTLKNSCWKGYTAIGTKKKNGKTVPNCVLEEYMMENEDQHNFTDYKDWKQHALDNKYKLVHGAWDTSAWKKDTHMGRFDGKKNVGFMKKIEPKKKVKKSA